MHDPRVDEENLHNDQRRQLIMLLVLLALFAIGAMANCVWSHFPALQTSVLQLYE